MPLPMPATTRITAPAPCAASFKARCRIPLSEALLEGRFVSGDTIQVDFIPSTPAELAAQTAASEHLSGSRNPFDSTNGSNGEDAPKGYYEFTAIAHREQEEEEEEPEDSETTEALEALLQ